MRINIVEKFDLYERLSELSLGLNEHKESKTIVEKAVHSLKSNFSVNTFNRFINELNAYSWITSVDEFITEYNQFVAENKYGIMLENTISKLSNMPTNTYKPVVDKLRDFVVYEEEVIKSRMSELSEFKYEPNVKYIVNMFEKEEFGAQETSFGSVSNVPISGTMDVNEGVVFNMSGRNYHLSNDKKQVTPYMGGISSEFAMSIDALKKFKYQGNDVFSMTLPKAKVKVDTGSGVARLFINESEIHDKKTLNTVLKTSGIVDYNDVATKSAIEYMLENAHKYVEIDFAKSVKTTNESFDIFKTADNTLHIAKYDEKAKGFIMEALDYDDVEMLSESLKKEFNIEMGAVLEGLEVNKEILDFRNAVSNVDINKIYENSEELYGEVKSLTESYNEMTDMDKEQVSESFEVLESISEKINNDKVLFILEAKEKINSTLNESEALESSLNLINEELKTLLK